MKYTLTVVEAETGAWLVLDNTGRQVWASPHFPTACSRAAADLDDQERKASWSLTTPTARRRARAQASAWAGQVHTR